MIPRRILLPALPAVLVTMLLAGCTPKVHINLDPTVLPRLTEVDCTSLVIEDDVSVKVIRSTSGQGWGLIGALADNAATKKRSARAEDLIPPLLEQTPDVDFRRQFSEALSFTKQDLPWLNIAEVTPTAAVITAQELKAITKPLLTLNTAYTLTPDCRHLTIMTRAHLWLPDENLAVFMGHYCYISDEVGELTYEEAVAAWAENGAAAYREAVSDGIAEIMKMLRYDLPPDGNLSEDITGEWVKVRLLNVDDGKTLRWTCTYLEQTPERVILREKGGNQWSMPALLIGDVKSAGLAERPTEF